MCILIYLLPFLRIFGNFNDQTWSQLLRMTQNQPIKTPNFPVKSSNYCIFYCKDLKLIKFCSNFCNIDAVSEKYSYWRHNEDWWRRNSVFCKMIISKGRKIAIISWYQTYFLYLIAANLWQPRKFVRITTMLLAMWLS